MGGARASTVIVSYICECLFSLSIQIMFTCSTPHLVQFSLILKLMYILGDKKVLKILDKN